MAAAIPTRRLPSSPRRSGTTRGQSLAMRRTAGRGTSGKPWCRRGIPLPGHYFPRQRKFQRIRGHGKHNGDDGGRQSGLDGSKQRPLDHHHVLFRWERKRDSHLQRGREFDGYHSCGDGHGRRRHVHGDAVGGVSDIWLPKTDFGGTARDAAVGFSIGAKATSGRDGMAQIRKTSGSTTLPPIPGRRRPISGEQRDIMPSASPSGAKATSGRDGMVQAGKTSGSTTLPPIPGRRRPISGGQRGIMPSAFPSGARATSGRDGMVHHTKRLLGVRPCRQYLDTEGRFRGNSDDILPSASLSGAKATSGRDGMVQFRKDFWEYDPAANTWTQKADFGGTARYYAVGFSIGSKGYIGTGWDGSYQKRLLGV